MIDSRPSRVASEPSGASDRECPESEKIKECLVDRMTREPNVASDKECQRMNNG